MKLTDIFHHPQLVSLLHQSSTSLTLGLHDPETGEVRQVVVRADMAVLPDEALLSVAIRDEHDDTDLARWWAKGDEADTACSLCGHAGQMEEGGMCWMPIGESGRTLSGYLPFADEGEPQPCGCYCPNSFSEDALVATWAITPNGQEFEVGSGGLFR